MTLIQKTEAVEKFSSQQAEVLFLGLIEETYLKTKFPLCESNYWPYACLPK